MEAGRPFQYSECEVVVAAARVAAAGVRTGAIGKGGLLGQGKKRAVS